MYLEINGSIYRLLIEQEQGGWFIPYEAPGAPIFLAHGEWGKRVAVPAEPDGLKNESRAETHGYDPAIDRGMCLHYR